MPRAGVARDRRAPVSAATAFYRSTIGKKAIMAVTGLIGIGFVVAHMAGNLQVFVGRARMNDYAAFLQGPVKEFVWLARIVLLAAVALHVTMAWQLTRRARAARPAGYAVRRPQASTIGARSMRWGGVLLLAFIVFHILHFTTGTIRPAGSFDEHDVYGNVVAGFRVWWVSAFYIAAMIALGLHLYHGAWSSLRTLGAAQPGNYPLRHRFAAVVAVVVWLGFTLVPVGVLLGVVR